jgi:LuxR family transcriptional regulator, maltose regulon positive regulatory protein
LLSECLGFLALIACLRGELTHARSLATRAVEISDDLGFPPEDRPPAAQVALAWVDTEQYELSAALDHVKLAESSDFISGDPVARTLLTLVRSRLLVARGDLAGALATVEGESAGFLDQRSWLVARLRLEAGHLRIANGEPAVALLEAENLSERLPADSALVAARARLLAGDEHAAEDELLKVLRLEAPLGVRVHGWLVEADRQRQRGAGSQARSALNRALKLAAPECLRRPFREAPKPLRDVLGGDPRLRATSAWLNLASQRPAAAPSRPTTTTTTTTTTQVAGRRPTGDPIVLETLTAKESEVLGHLAELLTTEEIAAAMYISVNTVRTHVRNILRKLGVSGRNAAVRQARELQLLPPWIPPTARPR